MKKESNQLVLIEDVDGLGRSGDVVRAKPGFVRNYLFPKKLAVMADAHTLKMRERLQEERAKKAAVDKKEAEALAKRINGKPFEIEVKVDPDGHMYGSVTHGDLVELFAKENMTVEKKNFLLPHAIKTLGEHTINMRLKENTLASFTLIINSDIEIVKPAKVEPFAKEEKTEE